ncbi:hypothetical protein CQ10_38720 [Bradyrhizobium valentinum]|nr:hypothetical protein CQ10_38720 [Bradyrhizobium valentinum]
MKAFRIRPQQEPQPGEDEGTHPRSLIGLFGLPALEPSRIFFVHPDELDQVFDTEVGERLDPVFSDT